MRGDATLFTRRDEVEAEWRIITPIVEAWAQLPPPQFPNYAAGSEGPNTADSLIRFDRHRWRSAAARRRLAPMTNPNNRVALVISDVDGTLLDENKQLTPGAPGAVQRLYAAGIRFTLASARPPQLVRELVRTLQVREPVACFNGALIVGPDEAVLHKLPMLPADAQLVADRILQRRLRSVGLDGQGLVRNQSDRCTCCAP